MLLQSSILAGLTITEDGLYSIENNICQFSNFFINSAQVKKQLYLFIGCIRIKINTTYINPLLKRTNKKFCLVFYTKVYFLKQTAYFILCKSK